MFASEENRPTRRFDGLARLYARCRPGYSDGAVTYIIGSPGGPVRLADVGCGTGISSRLFARHGAEVVGVEPNAEMRAEAEATPFEGPGAPPAYRDGRAEATGLPDAWADVVAAAQAFHWFYPEAALREFRRVLKPGGTVALLWNEPDMADPTTAAYCAALVESTPGT
ncbi:MAG TPA: methyltransferase domain-containing protein, partial [Gemmataceae bacterium]